MTLLHIYTPEKEDADSIADYLLREKLILTSSIIHPVERKLLVNGTVVEKRGALLYGKTKSLLFNDIEEALKEQFSALNYSLYSVPIVQMEWELSEMLTKETKKI